MSLEEKSHEIENELQHKEERDTKRVRFWQAIGAYGPAWGMLGKNADRYTEAQGIQARRALRLGAVSLVTVGVETLATIIILLGYYQQGMSATQLLANMTVACLCLLYGGLAYLVLLPVRYKLDGETEEKQ